MLVWFGVVEMCAFQLRNLVGDVAFLGGLGYTREITTGDPYVN